jgi:hypothetical protein
MTLNLAKHPDNIYYDLTLTNFNQDGTRLSQLKFNETRNTYFVPRANEYYLSIVRFQVDSYTLPTHFAEIQPNQGNPNLMNASFTLEYDNGAGFVDAYQVYCIWEPNTDIPVPPPPNANPNGLQSNSAYYYAYNFRHMIDIFNTALRDAFGQLQTANPVALANDLPPFFVWDEDSNKAILYADSGIVSGGSNPSRVGYNNYIPLFFPRIKVYMNRASESLLSSLPYDRMPINNTLGRIFRLKLGFPRQSLSLIPYYNNLVELPIVFNPSVVNRQFIKLEQEYSTISNWTPVSSVVFTSSTLPINVNSLSAPVIYVNNQVIQNSNNSNFAPIITDISSNEMVYKPNLLYVPSAQYRLVDLLTNSAINNIDIQVYWKDRFGNLNPFLFGSGATCTIKIAFFKKTLFNNNP